MDEETADDHIGLASTKTTDYINGENDEFDVDSEEFMNQVGNNKASENTSDVNKNSEAYDEDYHMNNDIRYVIVPVLYHERKKDNY